VSAPLLLSIVEIGGYPNFVPLYEAKGFTVEVVSSMRKATKLLKKVQPTVVVAEFNFQSDFRDRTSSLETLMATLQRFADCKVIVFYEQQQADQLARLLAVCDVFATLTFPIEAQVIGDVLEQTLELME